MSKILKFPKDFKWGVATASYQIEGAWKKDGKGESIWDRFSHTKGKIRDGHTGDIACDSYHRFKEDVKVMKSLGIKQYRFSISWPRILPNGKGRVNEKGVTYYHRLIDELLKNGITPYITMFHWDLPQNLEDEGGFRVKSTSYAFAEYAKVLAKRYSDKAVNWITLNEPLATAYAGYKLGMHAPGAKVSEKTLNQVIHNLLLSHGLGVLALGAYGKQDCNAGISMNPFVRMPATAGSKDYAAAKESWYSGKNELLRRSNEPPKMNWTNGWWFDPLYLGKYPAGQWQEKKKDVPVITAEEMKIISTPTDFLGLNIYSGMNIKEGKKGPEIVAFKENAPRMSSGGYITPEALYYGVRIPAERYGIKNVIVTENGSSCNDVLLHNGKVNDLARVDFFKKYLASLHKVFKHKIGLQGYFIWTLLDNFEWSAGYTERFGICYTDFPSLRRIPKASAYFYKEVIKNNGLRLENMK